MRYLEAAGANYGCTVSGYLLSASSIISYFTVECQQRTGYWCPPYICKLGENKCYKSIKYYVVDLRDNVILILFPLPPGVVVTVGCVLMLIYTTAADPPEPRS